MTWHQLRSHGEHFFFFNDTATPEIYTLSLHDALPIFLESPAQQYPGVDHHGLKQLPEREEVIGEPANVVGLLTRSEEHTSELQSRQYLVCRLLLEKKLKFLLSYCDSELASARHAALPG